MYRTFTFSIGLICIKPQVAHRVHSNRSFELRKVRYMALHLLLVICILNRRQPMCVFQNKATDYKTQLIYIALRLHWFIYIHTYIYIYIYIHTKFQNWPLCISMNKSRIKSSVIRLSPFQLWLHIYQVALTFLGLCILT